jgi:hypothetical protein
MFLSYEICKLGFKCLFFNPGSTDPDHFSGNYLTVQLTMKAPQNQSSGIEGVPPLNGLKHVGRKGNIQKMSLVLFLLVRFSSEMIFRVILRPQDVAFPPKIYQCPTCF